MSNGPLSSDLSIGGASILACKLEEPEQMWHLGGLWGVGVVRGGMCGGKGDRGRGDEGDLGGGA